MNLHKEEHEIVKQSTAEALFYLMAFKPFSEITVSELIKKAGIARSTYYRNYASKEEVLADYIDGILFDFDREYPVHSTKDRFEQEHILHVLDYVSRYQKQLQILHKSGLSALYLNRINKHVLEIPVSIHLSAKEKFDLYAFAGAEFNIVFNWILEDMKESKSEIARYIRGIR